MDSLPKINNLTNDLRNELTQLRKEIEKDVNYSANHADIITFVESAEEILHEFIVQMHNISSDIDMLNDTIYERR